MKKILNILFLMVMMGCGYQEITNEMELEPISLDFPSEICEIRTEWNKTYVICSEAKKDYLERYMKKGGCCKSCFEEDLYVILSLNYTGRELSVLESVLKSGTYNYPCSIYWEFLENNGVTGNVGFTILGNLKQKFPMMIKEVEDMAGKRECPNKNKPDLPDEEDYGDGLNPNKEIPDIVDDYEFICAKSVQEIYELIGREVYGRYVDQGNIYDLGLLKISYALNMSNNPISWPEYLMFGENESVYLVKTRALYEYLFSFYREPEIVTFSELKNKDTGIVVDTKDLDTLMDELSFVDIWNDGDFINKPDYIGNTFYFWGF